jgi:hypothetical protein
MSAIETTTPPPELPHPSPAPFELANGADDRPRWGFTVGCAIAVGIALLVLGALKGRAPRPATFAPSTSPESAAVDLFSGLDPFPLESPAPPPVSLPVAGPRARVMPGTLSVSGRLPREVIRRILGQNHGRLRMCYEAGLQANPHLQGRITARFVIGRDGAVSSVANAGSDLPDAGVVSCAVRAFYGLSFPRPEAGIVIVSYPVVMQPR